jgi:hypothetical protein
MTTLDWSSKYVHDTKVGRAGPSWCGGGLVEREEFELGGFFFL